MKSSPEILRTAHGTAADGGALIVAEAPALAEIPPTNAALTEQGLALRKGRGRPFARANRAAAGRGPSLTRMGVKIECEDAARRSVLRRAEALRRHRVREMTVLHGGSVSSAVTTELASWALATAYSRLAYEQGDSVRGAALAEKASGHALRAIGIAEREAKARPRKRIPFGPASPWAAPVEPPKGDS